VVLTDLLPAGTQFVQATAGCSYTAGPPKKVTCPIGTMASGGNSVREIVLRLTNFSFHGTFNNPVSVTSTSTDPVSSNDSAYDVTHVYNNSHDHHLTVSKAEQHVDFEPGQVRNVVLDCPKPGDIMLDGSFRIDNVDQDTGTLRSVSILQQSALGDSYEFTAVNYASGRAQAKVFGTCISKDTEEAGAPSHSHQVRVEAPQTVTVNPSGAGHIDVKVPCNSPAYVEPAAPGYSVTGAEGYLTYSMPGYDGGGNPAWDFGFEVTQAGQITFSIRCVRRYLGTTNGHSHELWLSHTDKYVNVPPNAPAAGQYDIDCSDEAKGIVAGYDLPFGTYMIGHDPQPKRRSFKILNETSLTQSVHLYLLCVGDRTGTDPPPPAEPEAVTPVATPAKSGATIPVSMTCPVGGCGGSVELLAAASGSRAVAAKARVIGRATFKSNRVGRVVAKVTIFRAYRNAVRSGKIRRVTAVVRKNNGKVATRQSIRLKRG
jgi:hypothetical protein